jgi:hypothetical protein
MVALFAGHRAVLHTGGFRSGFRSLIVRFPDDRLTIIAASNCTGCGRTAIAALVHHYVHDDIAPGKDSKPDDTTRLIKALQAAGAGKPDATVFADNSMGIDEAILPALKDATITFQARHELKPNKLLWHGQALVDYVSLRVKLPDGDELHLDLYRDDKGIVRDVELRP